MDLAATVPIHFVVADVIVCMEGNGPLAGTSRRLDQIVLSDDPVAADATCARLMGFVPKRIPHIGEPAKFLGNIFPDRIIQLREPAALPEVPFKTVPQFEFLRT